MTVFIIQSLLLLGIAFILGCLLGSVMHWLFGSKPAAVSTAPAKPVAAPVEQPAPVARVADPAPAPKPVAAPKPGAAPAKKDDLKRIRGIGPQNEARLNAIGVYTFAEVAQWSADMQRDIGERLAFPGRIEREDWVSQAAKLAKGETTDFAKRVDQGEVASSTGSAKADTGATPSVLSAAPAGGGDDLTLIEGVGNALEKKLNAIGIYTFEQVSQWTAEQQIWIGNEIGFPGRPERENWTGEAAALAKGRAPTGDKKPAKGQITAKRKS
ncbi:MAG: hypothetical protein AAFN43_03720 [Pseudomonadota bacterium]